MNPRKTTAAVTSYILVTTCFTAITSSSASASGNTLVASPPATAISIEPRAKKKTTIRVRQLTPYQLSPFQAHLRITVTSNKKVRTKQQIRIYRVSTSKCVGNATTPKLTWKRIATKTVRFKGKRALLKLTTKRTALRFVSVANSKLNKSARTWQFHGQYCERH